MWGGPPGPRGAPWLRSWGDRAGRGAGCGAGCGAGAPPHRLPDQQLFDVLGDQVGLDIYSRAGGEAA